MLIKNMPSVTQAVTPAATTGTSTSAANATGTTSTTVTDWMSNWLSGTNASATGSTNNTANGTTGGMTGGTANGTAGGTNAGMGNQMSCPDGKGKLPACGNLAFPYIPMQGTDAKKYTQTEALNNGTLYPGLNLPFHLKVNASNVVNTPLTELQALEFVLLELGLYLDTHPDDQEAFALFQKYAELERTARQTYGKENGALFKRESAQNDSFTWVQDPWPWNKSAE